VILSILSSLINLTLISEQFCYFGQEVLFENIHPKVHINVNEQMDKIKNLNREASGNVTESDVNNVVIGVNLPGPEEDEE